MSLSVYITQQIGMSENYSGIVHSLQERSCFNKVKSPMPVYKRQVKECIIFGGFFYQCSDHLQVVEGSEAFAEFRLLYWLVSVKLFGQSFSNYIREKFA